MELDYSKGLALHRLYGHATFMIEASKKNKSKQFASSICAALKCDGRPTDWRSDLNIRFK